MTALKLRVPPVLVTAVHVVTAVHAGLMWLAAALVPSLTFSFPGGAAIFVACEGAGAVVAVAASYPSDGHRLP